MPFTQAFSIIHSFFTSLPCFVGWQIKVSSYNIQWRECVWVNGMWNRSFTDVIGGKRNLVIKRVHDDIAILWDLLYVTSDVTRGQHGRGRGRGRHVVVQQRPVDARPQVAETFTSSTTTTTTTTATTTTTKSGINFIGTIGSTRISESRSRRTSEISRPGIESDAFSNWHCRIGLWRQYQWSHQTSWSKIQSFCRNKQHHLQQQLKQHLQQQ